MSDSIPVKWLAVQATQIWPHQWPAAEFQYTSIEAPVEADEYERQVKRAEAAEAVLADIPYAPLLRFTEAVLMRGQPLQFDVDAVAKWVDRNKVQS